MTSRLLDFSIKIYPTNPTELLKSLSNICSTHLFFKIVLWLLKSVNVPPYWRSCNSNQTHRITLVFPSAWNPHNPHFLSFSRAVLPLVSLHPTRPHQAHPNGNYASPILHPSLQSTIPSTDRMVFQPLPLPPTVDTIVFPLHARGQRSTPVESPPHVPEEWRFPKKRSISEEWRFPEHRMVPGHAKHVFEWR